jgi:NAD(P)-dependent dehydrogenase (short-subunit alcohol dehydrogenase family)
VTGAGSGIGLATARAFAEAGAAVVLADKDEEPLNAAASKLTAAGRDAIAVRCDVTEDAEVAWMVARTASKFGRLDAAFNSAGIMQRRVDTAEIEAMSGTG